MSVGQKRVVGGEFWTDGYFASTVEKHGDETKIGNYVKNQGIEDYKQLHQGKDRPLFSWKDTL
jgi:REP element-mobilizing transposase RayT